MGVGTLAVPGLKTIFFTLSLRRQDSNLRPSGNEPDELPLLHFAICFLLIRCAKLSIIYNPNKKSVNSLHSFLLLCFFLQTLHCESVPTVGALHLITAFYEWQRKRNVSSSVNTPDCSTCRGNPRNQSPRRSAYLHRQSPNGWPTAAGNRRARRLTSLARNSSIKH